MPTKASAIFGSWASTPMHNPLAAYALTLLLDSPREMFWIPCPTNSRQDASVRSLEIAVCQHVGGRGRTYSTHPGEALGSFSLKQVPLCLVCCAMDSQSTWKTLINHQLLDLHKILEHLARANQTLEGTWARSAGHLTLTKHTQGVQST